jgi:hypothetical protein
MFEEKLMAMKFEGIMALLRELPKHVDAEKLMQVLRMCRQCEMLVLAHHPLM